MVLMLLISTKVAGQSATPCNSFPKIFGGSSTNGTAINQLDIYQDYLAFGADLCDIDLTGTTSCIPYLALSSVSIAGRYYWAKALTQKTDSTFDGLQFSNDGALIIGHIGSWSSTTTTCIVVFNVAHGNILSARGYSAGDFQNYNYQMRSMIVSSGASPIAYVLSNYKTAVSCTGQHLFKFNPLTYSTPVWKKQTIGININNCNHLGLVFGRNQQYFYAFSKYNNQPVVSFLDTDGNAIWQQYIDNYFSGPNILQYKQIDPQTDMIIATNGNLKKFYNRIISLSDSPYSLLEKKYFFDSSTNRLIYALYIIDQNNIVSLLYDDFTYDTYLATIDFQAATIYYQKAFPKIINLRSAIFTSPTVYYTSSFDFNFYKDQSSPAQTFSMKQAIIYSSDQASTSCYSMTTSTSPTLITMSVVSSSLSSLQTKIYETSSVTFFNDSQAQTTVNINQLKLTKLSFCLQYPFTDNTVIQTNTQFSVALGVSDVYLPIAPFSATLNCGSYTNTWTYAGFDNTDNHLLNNTTDFMSVDSTTGSIFVSKLKPNGTYYVKVVGTLTDFVTKSSAVFTINMNTVPVFQNNLTDVTVSLLSSINYTFPSIIDLDYGASTSVSVIRDSATNTLPNFITFSSSYLIINPKDVSQVKAYNMIVIITDNKDTKKYEFILNVIYSPPKLTSQIQSPFIVSFGLTTIYNLPSSIHPQGLPFTTNMMRGTPFVKQLSSTQLSITPKDCSMDFGNFTIQIKLEDTQPLSILFQIQIVVKNSPPEFSGSSTQSLDQKILINSIVYQDIPSFTDPEGCSLKFSISPVILNYFVTLQGNQIVYSPNQLYQIGKSEITLICSDNLGLSGNKKFNLIVFQKPKFGSTIVNQINLISNKLRNYSLPVIEGITDEYIAHSSNLPRFVSFSFPTYKFLPDKVSDLGIFNISGQLKNTYSFISFTFFLNVTNQPPFLQNKTSDQILALNSQLSYFFPEAVDGEDQAISYAAFEVGKLILPPFAKFLHQTREFQFAPTKLDSCKNYSIQIDIKDSFGAFSSYTFIVSLYNSSSFLKEITNQNNNLTKAESAFTASGFDISTLNLKKKQSGEIETYILGIFIIKVTRDQKATLKITNVNVQKAYISELMGQITDQSIEVVVIQANSIIEKIPFKILSKDSTNFLMQISLKYPNPQNISTKLPDTLIIRTLSRVQILKKQIQTILPENTLSEANIPPQATNKLEQAASNAVQGGRIDFTGDTTSNLVIGFAIQMAWIQLEDISFLAVNSMLTISVPGIPSIIQGVMIKYMYFDILYTELWMDEFMSSIGIDLDTVTNDTALNIQFSENGFNSKQFLKNSGSSLFFLIMYILGWIILLLLSLLSRFSNNIACLQQKLARQLMWKQSINFMMSQFPPLFLCSLINLYDLRFKEDLNLFSFSTYISIIVVISLIIALFLIFQRVWKLTRILNNELVSEFNEKYQPLTDSLQQTYLSKIIFFWKPLYLLRWALTLTALIAFQDKPSLQILSLLSLSFIQQCLILRFAPFNSRAVNIISFYNEAAVSMYLYLSFMLSDYLESQIEVSDSIKSSIRLQVAWIMTVLLIFTIFLNFLFAVGNIGLQIFRILKSKIKCKRGLSARERQIEGLKYLKDAQKHSVQNSVSVVAVDLTKFEQESISEHSQPKFIEKKTKQYNNFKSYKVLDHQKEFHDMFEIKT